MRKLFFILYTLLILPHVGESQSKTKFRIKKQYTGPCVAALDSIYWDCSSPTIVKDILMGHKLEVMGSCHDSEKIVGFTMSIGLKREFIEMVSKGDSISPEMVKNLLRCTQGSYIIIKNIQTISKTGIKGLLQGLIFKVDTASQPIIKKNSYYPIYILSLGGRTGDIEMSVQEITTAGKLTLIGEDTNSIRIIGFTMCLLEKEVNKTYESKNEFITEEMKKEIITLPKGAYIIIKDVKLNTANEGRIPGITIRIKK